MPKTPEEYEQQILKLQKEKADLKTNLDQALSNSTKLEKDVDSDKKEIEDLKKRNENLNLTLRNSLNDSITKWDKDFKMKDEYDNSYLMGLKNGLEKGADIKDALDKSLEFGRNKEGSADKKDDRRDKIGKMF